jgi:peptide/nickel transport system substrate-binding protein
MLLIAIACGDDATLIPAATPTPAPTATPQAVLAPEDIRSLVTEAVMAAAPPPPEVVSAAEIQRMVETAVVAAAPKGATAEEVKQLVEAGVAAVSAQAVSKEEVASLVSKAVADATSAQPEPVSAAEIERIVKAAIPPTPTPAPTVDPRALVVAARYGGVVPMRGAPGLRGWDPYKYGGLQSISPNGMIYNQLVEYDPLNPNEIIGDLAESWEVSPDGLSFTFSLHDNVKWTDGETLDADDVVFSLNRLIDKTEPRPKAGIWSAYMAANNPVEKVDQGTVKMNLAFPSGAFMRFLAVDFNKMLPEHVLAAGVDIDVYSKDAVGSGAFKNVDFKEEVSFEFAKNPNYFKSGQPYFDGIKAFIMGDKGTEIAAYKTGRILMSMSVQSRMDAEDSIKLENDQDFSAKFDIFWMKGGSGISNVWVNDEKEPFGDSKVRRAIFLALDRQKLTDHFGKGRYDLGGLMMPSNPFALPEEELVTLPGYRQLDGKKHPDDIAEANKLMAEAGFPDGFKTSLLVSKSVFWPDAAQILKQEFKRDLNIDIDIILSDIGSVFGALLNQDYEMALFGAGISIPDPDDVFPQLFLNDGARNWTKYEVPGVRDLFNQQQREPDMAKRRELNHEMQRLVLAGAHTGSMYLFQASAVPVSKRIRTERGGFIQGFSQYTALKHAHEWLEPE